MSAHRRHTCPSDDLDEVCDPGSPFCEDCLKDWPCPDALAEPGDETLGDQTSRSDPVLAEVRAHRAEQVARYGLNEDLKDGVGPGSTWALPLTFYPAEVVEKMFRAEYGGHRQPTWMHLVREEVAEAFMAGTPEELRAELIQVAALCVSWIETLDAR